MDKKARSQHAERLLSDDVLKSAFDVVSMRYQSVFTDPSATEEHVLEARRKVLALEQVKSQLRAYVGDGKMIEKRDQHRVND